MSSSPLGRRESVRARETEALDDPGWWITEPQVGHLRRLLDIADAADRGAWPLAASLRARERGGD